MNVSRSITKSVDLCVTPERAWGYLSDLMNWPKWAIVNMKSVRPRLDGWYEMETKQGKGQLRMQANKALGLLDHVWKDPQASWTVPARVVANGEGCTLIMTFFQPPVLSNAEFEAAANDVDKEMSKLKEILESQAGFAAR
jgi:hypothetical protein